MTVPSVAIPSRACEEPSCRRLLALTSKNFPPDGRGGFRRVCRRCFRARENRTKALRRERRGDKRCNACGIVKPLEAFDVIATRKSGPVRKGACRDCAELVEAVRERHERWAVTLTALLAERGLTLGQYRALRGSARRAFEHEWTARMRAHAIAAGEWCNEEERRAARMAAEREAVLP
jgi:hypothetical protein